MCSVIIPWGAVLLEGIILHETAAINVNESGGFLTFSAPREGVLLAFLTHSGPVNNQLLKSVTPMDRSKELKVSPEDINKSNELKCTGRMFVQVLREYK